MYLLIDIDSDIQVIVFDWIFEYEVIFDIRDRDIWYFILYANDDEWSDIEMPSDSELPEDIYWFCLSTDEEFDDAI